MVQSEPHSHMEYVNFEPSQHTTMYNLEDFHIVRAIVYIIINFLSPWKEILLNGEKIYTRNYRVNN